MIPIEHAMEAFRRTEAELKRLAHASQEGEQTGLSLDVTEDYMRDAFEKFRRDPNATNWVYLEREMALYQAHFNR